MPAVIPSDFSGKLNGYQQNFHDVMKRETRTDLALELSTDHKEFKQIQKDVAVYDQLHNKSPYPRSETYYAGMGKLADRIEKLTKPLVEDIKKAAAREKSKNSKSQLYRHLKVYIADIESIAPSILQEIKYELERDKVLKVNLGKVAEEVDRKARNILTSLRQMGTGLQAGIAHAARFCKAVNANPTHVEWNKVNSDSGLRKLSTPLMNLEKYCFRSLEELLSLTENRGAKASEFDVATTPAVLNQIKQLQKLLKEDGETIKKLGKKTGTDAFDGSIAFLADDVKAHLGPEATPVIIIKNVRRVHDMVKEIVPIAEKLKKFDA